jgi:hypothetical protein
MWPADCPFQSAHAIVLHASSLTCKLQKQWTNTSSTPLVATVVDGRPYVVPRGGGQLQIWGGKWHEPLALWI